MRIELWYELECPSVLLRRYADTYTMEPVKMTRTMFAKLFGIHVPEWTPTVWVDGTQYRLIDRKEEIDELERLFGRNGEPLSTAIDRKGGNRR